MDVHATAKHLKLVPLPDFEGPSSTAALAATERQTGRALAPTHRLLLSELGGCLGFDDGYVYVGDRDLDVSELLDASDADFGIATMWAGHAGQIPEGWYPFAQNVAGDLFLVASDGGVYHVVLGEHAMTSSERPQTSGDLVATSFDDFLTQLRLPEWATESSGEHLLPSRRAERDQRAPSLESETAQPGPQTREGDAEVERTADTTPVVALISDDVLGELRYDMTRKCHTGTVPTSHGVVGLEIHRDGEHLDIAMENARKVVAAMATLFPRVVNKLTHELLELKNQTWLEEDENEVTEADFRDRARLSSITILGGGMTTFFFNDDDMFGGHALLVTVDSAGEIWEPELFG